MPKINTYAVVGFHRKPSGLMWSDSSNTRRKFEGATPDEAVAFAKMCPDDIVRVEQRWKTKDTVVLFRYENGLSPENA